MSHRWLLRIAILAVLLGLLITLLMRSFITIKADFHHHKDQDEGTLSVTGLWGLVRLKRKLDKLEIKPTKEGPAVAVDGTQRNPSTDQTTQQSNKTNTKFTSQEFWRFIKRVPEWRTLYGKVKPILRKLAARMWLESLEIQAIIGTGDAVTTGILCGSASSVLYTITGWACSRIGQFNQPKIVIQPTFQSLAWSVDATCIVKVRLGHATIAAFQLIRLWRRRSPHGTSHSRVNAYRHVEYP